MLTRERRPMPAIRVNHRQIGDRYLPAPAPLPSLSAALAGRAAVFGPFDGDEPPAASLGLFARCAAALRSVADVLEPAGAGR